MICPVCNLDHIGGRQSNEYAVTKAGYLVLARMRAAENFASLPPTERLLVTARDLQAAIDEAMAS